MANKSRKYGGADTYTKGLGKVTQYEEDKYECKRYLILLGTYKIYVENCFWRRSHSSQRSQGDAGKTYEVLELWNNLTPLTRNKWICYVTIVKKTGDEEGTPGNLQNIKRRGAYPIFTQVSPLTTRMQRSGLERKSQIVNK